jgi:hypothetical protein
MLSVVALSAMVTPAQGAKGGVVTTSTSTTVPIVYSLGEGAVPDHTPASWHSRDTRDSNVTASTTMVPMVS